MKLSYSGLFGGSGYDTIWAVATDPNGFLYLTGETASESLAGCTGPPTSRGRDVFVLKLTPGGTRLVYCAIVGGTGNDSGKAIATDSAGNVWVAGTTNSADFPQAGGGLIMSPLGQDDAFVIKLSPTGDVVYTALIGGSGIDGAAAVGVDSSGAAFVAGYSTSQDLVTSAGALQPGWRGTIDGFIVKLDPAGRRIVYSTHLGGSGMDGVQSLQVASDGQLWLGGYTESADFPGGIQQRLRDGFVVRLNASGSALTAAYSVSGMGEDGVTSIWLDARGQLTAGGYTSSVDFPASPGSAQTVKNVGRDAFVCQWDPSSGSRTFCTLLGGSGADGISALVRTPDGRIWVAGSTTSLDFPVFGAIQSTPGSTADSWIACLKPDGSAWQFSSYLRGSLDDAATGLAAASGRVWVSGSTNSPNFPFTGDGPQAAAGGNMDGFLVKVVEGAGPEAVQVTEITASSSAQQFLAEASHPGGSALFVDFELSFNSPLDWPSGCHLAVDPIRSLARLLNDDGSTVASGIVGTSTVLDSTACTLDLSSARLERRGNSVSFSFTLAIRPTSYANLGSARWIFARARDANGLSTGWIAAGHWTVSTVNIAPVLTSLFPNAGQGMRQKFRISARDENGSSDLRIISVVISSSLHWERACFFSYFPVYGVLALGNDDATAYLGGMFIGTQNAKANSQCAISALTSSVTASGNEIQLDVDILFFPAFGAVDGSLTKQVYVYVGDMMGAQSPFQQAGSWTLTGS
ncbi:MAG: SBBP repeat-containing protein [Acidobacteria bacterium]|nr:SBBP repeat-containing protein [Acidobacteriota bacterium]